MGKAEDVARLEKCMKAFCAALQGTRVAMQLCVENFRRCSEAYRKADRDYSQYPDQFSSDIYEEDGE